ncbi:hypothetical protein WK66_29380 [Burkholderia ubonensis]|nr:hypothetical protein WK66_29380 [Burkholderia ubonensis]
MEFIVARRQPVREEGMVLVIGKQGALRKVLGSRRDAQFGEQLFVLVKMLNQRSQTVPQAGVFEEECVQFLRIDTLN